MRVPAKHPKNLIIHPDDRSTDFLRAVYENVPDKLVITGGDYNIWDIDNLISKADNVYLLGHGTKSGLLSVGQFSISSGYVVDGQSADLLRSKKKVVMIWCYSSDYAYNHKLDNAFASGMFISEVSEADYCGLPDQSKEDIDIQCDYFCKLVGAVANNPVNEIYDFVSREFAEVAKHCPVAEYNHSRLWVA